MTTPLRPILRPLQGALYGAFAFGALGLPAMAQIPLTGPLSDSTTGPLAPGTVYTISGTTSVPTGETLTVGAGVVIKCGFDARLLIQGTLDCQGTGPNSIIITDARDDTAGGDTNGDGAASVPAPGWWRGIEFSSGSGGSTLDGVTVRYGGRFVANYEFLGVAPTLNNCRSEFCSNEGFDLNGAEPFLNNCVAVGNSGTAINGASIAGLARMQGVSASGNGRNRINVTNGSVPAGTTVAIGPNNLIGSAAHFVGSLVVPDTSTLRLAAGTTFKMDFDNRAQIFGTLDCNGTAANRVVFTDERDDTSGGDTNSDGAASVPLAGWWRGLEFGADSDASTLDFVDVRYGGRFVSCLEFLSSAAPRLSDCRVRGCTVTGVDLNGGAFPTLERLDVRDCQTDAVTGVDIRALENISDSTFVGNGFDRINVTQGTVAAGESVTLRPDQGYLNALYLTGNLVVQAGGSLTVAPGTVLKMRFDNRVVLDGMVRMLGTAGSRIVITDERDDSVGGDLNGDGSASVPAAGWWRGLEIQDDANGSRFEFVDVKYGGRFVSGFELSDGAGVTLNRCAVYSITGSGFDFNNTTTPCVVDRVRSFDCTTDAITSVRLERLQDFTVASGSGNGRNTIVVGNGTLTEDVTIERRNQFNGSVLVTGSVSVPSGFSLNLQPGVVLKMDFDNRFQVAGALSVRGSLTDPVIITAETDDSVGGNTNGGADDQVPFRGYWRGIELSSTTDTSIIVGLEVRYGGRFVSNVQCTSGLVALREVRSSFCSQAGFDLSNQLIDPERLIAFENSGPGVRLSGGAFDARQLTSTGNQGVGILATAAYTGGVRDSILWGNVGGAQTGLGAGRVTFSNGAPALAGTGGNIDSDPLFVNAAVGNLALRPASPCINTGDPSSPDDPDSTRADMGALFFNFCEPSIICTQDVFPPCAPDLTYEGFASLSSPLPFTLTLNAAPTQSFAIFFYGFGTPTVVSGLFGDVCVAGPYQRTAPIASGGNAADGPCAGTFEFDFNAYAQSGMDPAIVAGANVIGHMWFRYGAAPSNALFSDGVQIPVCP